MLEKERFDMAGQMRTATAGVPETPEGLSNDTRRAASPRDPVPGHCDGVEIRQGHLGCVESRSNDAADVADVLPRRQLRDNSPHSP